MRQISIKIIKCLLISLLLITCFSCKQKELITKNDYLLLLKETLGFKEDNTYDDLIAWDILKKEELINLEEYLNYDFLSLTLGRLLNIESDYFKALKEKNYFKNVKKVDYVNVDQLEKILDKLKKEINNQSFEKKYEYEINKDVVNIDDYSLIDNCLISQNNYSIGDIVFLKNDNEYKEIIAKDEEYYYVKDANYEDIFSRIDIEDTNEINFDDAIIIIDGKTSNEEVYHNLNKELLKLSLSDVFYKNGFRISYNFSGNNIKTHISKNIKGLNVFFDIALSNIKPSYKWKYDDGKIEEAYFKIDYQMTSELGVSKGKYNDYVLDLDNIDKSNIMKFLNSIIKPKENEDDIVIPICEIKVPIPNVPNIYFNIDLLARLYTSGKAEILVTLKNQNGFEIRNGKMRIINDSEKDLDFIIGGTSKATVGLNFNLEAINYRLMDVELDGGIRAAVSTTMHLYDEDGYVESKEINYEYSDVSDLVNNNEKIKICGDVSLNWLLELTLNTDKSLLNKIGVTYHKKILDKDDQIFKNKTHIENGIFMDSCTRRKDKYFKQDKSVNDINKIILEKYAVVINVNNEYILNIKALPNGYQLNDLTYESSDINVAVINSGIVKGLKMGSSKIIVKTKDNKYQAAINVLVSDN